MVYNNALQFTEDELRRLEAATEIQYVGVQLGSPAPQHREVAARLARAGKKLIIQIWWGPDPPHSWSRFSMANIAMDARIRAEFFREVVDPIIDSVGPENVHTAHLLEETGACFATDMLEPGDPEDLLDGTGGTYDSPFYTGYSGRDSYGGPWMLTLRRHNDDFVRFSGGCSLFEAAIWKGPQRDLFRRWVGRRVQALANNRFAEHLHEKYPNILATTWDGPNFGGNVWADTPAMLNSLDGFTANCYSSPLNNYIFARTMRALDFDKAFQFMSWVGRDNLDVNLRRTMLTGIYAVGSSGIHLWEEPQRCYARDDLWKIMVKMYGAFSRLPVFRHSPEVLVIAGRWGVPSRYLKNFDAAHHEDAEGLGLERYRLVLLDRAGHPGLKEYVADGGLAVTFEHCPVFLRDEGILTPHGQPAPVSGVYQPDDWWREHFGLKESYTLDLKPASEFTGGENVRQAGGIAYRVPYGKGEILVLPAKPEKEGRDSDWQVFVYDLIGGLLHARGVAELFDRHFATRDSGGRYFEITSDDGAVSCCFYYSAGQEGPAVQVRGIDIFTGDKDPVLGPGRSAAIVAHAATKAWAPPAPPDRKATLVKPAPKGARRGLAEFPELPPVLSLGPTARALEPGSPPVWESRKTFRDWAVETCRYRLVIRFESARAGMAGQPLVLSGKNMYELTGLEDLAWASVRVFVNGKELPVQVDERDGTGHYQPGGNGRLDYDDELVFAVDVPAGKTAYRLYYDSQPSGRPGWPDARVTFEKISTDIADAVMSNGRLTLQLKGPAKHPGVNRLDNHGAGAITECSLDGKAFTRIRHNWANFFFDHPWSGEGGWTQPERLISGPLRTIVRIRLPHFIRKNEADLKTFEGNVTNYFAVYGTAPVLDIEQRVEYRWSERMFRANCTFYTSVGSANDPDDLLFVPVAGTPRRVPLVGTPYSQAYLEHRPEQGWMALLDPAAKHGCALFYARMPEIRENLAWVDYAPRRELTPSLQICPDGCPMRVKYTNRIMQTDNVLDRRFRIVGLTEEDEHAVAAGYLLWGEELSRLARLEAQMSTREHK